MDEFTNESVVDFEESVQDDAAQASQESQESQVQPISEFLHEAPEGEEPQDGASNEKVNSGLKGRLLASEKKGYDRGKQEAEAAWQQEKAQYEARISKLQELEIKDQARTLAKEQHISEELAERIVRAEAGVPRPQQEQTQQNQQPRDAQGRFVSKDADYRAYADKLLEQASHIKDLTGIDVMSIYNQDDDVKRRIASREIDFYGLAKEIQSKPAQRKMPPVVRGSNGSTARSHGIASLTDDQLDELDAQLERGVVYDMRR